MATRKIYWDEPLRFSADTAVVSQGEVAGRPALEFEATTFCPESGGQPRDRGRIDWEGGGAEVLDAVDVGGRLLHVLEAQPGVDLPSPGGTVKVSVDEWRRRDHMSQHTGQHLLSRALLEVANAPTVAVRMGEAICTVDTSAARLADEAIAEAEVRVARVVLEDRPVRIRYPSSEELAAMALRRELKVTSGVRVVEVEGFDLAACGGTHCERTGQVGLVHVAGVERYKGGLRLSFHAGLRALGDYRAKEVAIWGLAQAFSCGIEGVTAAVQKLKAQAEEAARAAAGLRGRLAGHEARQLVEKAPRLGSPEAVGVVVELADEPLDYLRSLAQAIASTPNAVAIVSGASPDGVRVVVQRGSAVERFDAGAAMKRIAEAAGGRGGGRPDRAEGVVPDAARARGAAQAELDRLRG